MPADAAARVRAASLSLAAALFVLLSLVGLNAAAAQGVAEAPPNIRNLVIGQPIGAQPTNFQEFACGTNGGPPSLPISGFADFGRCQPEASGLREVQFQYDDELYYRALANYDQLRADYLKGTRWGDFPIIASALIDDEGVVRGVRVVTDDRISDNDRRFSYGLAEYVRGIYGVAGWECSDIPAEPGENPVGNRLIKEDCRRVGEDGLVIATEARLLRRPGQSLVDPGNGELRPGLFVSTGRMEIYQAAADGTPILGDVGGTPVMPVAEALSAIDDPLEAFLAGAAIDCPGCDLAGADLKRRNLTGANLAGADLTGATLHRAVLAGANLDGAVLTGADLNVADLKRASFIGADLSSALLYGADAAGADFSGANLDSTMAEAARFTSAVMVGAQWQTAYLFGTNLAGADLTDADLTDTLLREADLQRATLSGATLTDADFQSARLESANLSGAIALRADFLQANLANANFTDADLTEARLLRARSSGINLTGATLTGTVMPDGDVGE